MKKMYSRYLIILSSVLLFCCGSSSSTVNQVSIEQLEQLANKKLIEFKAETALPLLTTDAMKVNNRLLSSRGDSPSRIMLDKGYYLKIKKDSSSAELPYYGEVRTADYDFGNNSNILFKGDIKEFSSNNQKNKKLIIEYNINTNNENYSITLEIFKSKSANLIINATRRNQIKYQGEVVFHDMPEDLTL